MGGGVWKYGVMWVDMRRIWEGMGKHADAPNKHTSLLHPDPDLHRSLLKHALRLAKVQDQDQACAGNAYLCPQDIPQGTREYLMEVDSLF